MGPTRLMGIPLTTPRNLSSTTSRELQTHQLIKETSAQQLSQGSKEFAPAQHADGPEEKKEEHRVFEREQAVARREAELEERENRLQREFNAIRLGDWPSKCCRLARHNINEDVPAGQRRFVVWVSYIHFLSLAFIKLVNCGCVTAALASPNIKVDGGNLVAAWFFSLLLLFIVPPLAFVLWHKRLYNAFVLQSSLSFIIFFVFFGLTTCYEIVAAIAPPFTATTQFTFAGWINAVQLLEDRSKYADVVDDSSALNVVPILYACCASLFTLLAITSIYLFAIAGKAFKQGQYSGSKAKKEFQRNQKHNLTNGSTKSDDVYQPDASNDVESGVANQV